MGFLIRLTRGRAPVLRGFKPKETEGQIILSEEGQ